MAIIQITKSPDNGPRVGQQHTIERERTVLGRHPECDIVLDVAAVSRQHARLLRQGEDFFVEDLGSRNGTHLNGRATQGAEPLREGDRFRICDLEFAFYLTEPSQALSGPMLDGVESSIALIVDDEGDEDSTTGSTVMSKLDISSSRSGAFLSARPEVKLSAMIEIAQNLGHAVSLDDVMPSLLDSLFKIFVQADRGFIILEGPKPGTLIPKAIKYRRAGSDETARISRTIVRRAMESQEALLSADAASDERFEMAQSIADFHIRSLMCAPLLGSNGTSLGVIQIDTLDRRSRFSPDDLEVLASVASQAAIAIENAQLHESALRQEAIRRDLELAHKVQQGLLPEKSPTVDGYHFFSFYDSANEVGGDYFDYVPLSDGRIGVVLGDVSGKGVAAALLMAKLAGEVRAELSRLPDAAEAVSQINATFARPGWDDRFVTFVAAVLDPASHALTIVNAGHMPPLLRHANGEVEEIGEDEAGLPLGVADEFQYESYHCKLAPGDYLTIFTDGFSEAMNAEGELYGMDRLRAAVGDSSVGTEQLGDHVLADVRAFVGGHPQSDDMCISCFGRLES